MKSSCEITNRRSHRTGSTGSTAIDVMLASIMLLVVVASGYLSVTRHDVAMPQNARIVVVGSGQNLWSLAEENPVQGLDTAQTVALIRLMNSKNDSGLNPGEAVIVPTASNEH